MRSRDTDILLDSISQVHEQVSRRRPAPARQTLEEVLAAISLVLGAGVTSAAIVLALT